jgi:hypothetical protein
MNHPDAGVDDQLGIGHEIADGHWKMEQMSLQ